MMGCNKKNMITREEIKPILTSAEIEEGVDAGERRGVPGKEIPVSDCGAGAIGADCFLYNRINDQIMTRPIPTRRGLMFMISSLKYTICGLVACGFKKQSKENACSP
mmetsp:Transcript_5484/g.6035  ORF Transcript_5484/g.6035 Transcript_5484/m.6035 type:complete len:107 (-) Transcript_5484:1162-1482(-)